MRILVVTDYDYPTGGIEEMVFEFVKEASVDNHCRYLSWGKSLRMPPAVGGHAVEHGDVRPAWDEFDWCDAVLVVTSFNVRILARLAADYALARPKPMVVVVQTSSHSTALHDAALVQLSWLADLAISARIVAVSNDVARSLKSELGTRLDSSRITTIENGARLAAAPKIRGRRNLLFIGRPHPQKGYHFFERLADELLDLGIDFHANTVSVDPDRLIDGVSYTKCLSDRELLSLFDSTDLLVAPYLHSDGLPLVLAEALSCSVPIVGFDAPGVGDLLRRHGQKVVPSTYEDLKSAVTSWFAGELEVEHPNAEQSVPLWSDQIPRYLKVLREELDRFDSGAHEF